VWNAMRAMVSVAAVVAAVAVRTAAEHAEGVAGDEAQMLCALEPLAVAVVAVGGSVATAVWVAAEEADSSTDSHSQRHLDAAAAAAAAERPDVR